MYLMYSNLIICNIFTIIQPIYLLENVMIQILVLYTIYILYINSNIYYTLLYIFSLIIMFGLFICMYQLDLFTGFLWITEFTIIFIAIILLLYLNIDGLKLKFNNNIILYNLPIIFILLNIFNSINYMEIELFTQIELHNFNYYDDFYEAFNNNNQNDFVALIISLYLLNSIEFIIIGLLLLLGSLVCVNLYKSNKNCSIIKQSSMLDIFNFFKDFIDFSFIRKQNLNEQNNKISSIRFF